MAEISAQESLSKPPTTTSEPVVLTWDHSQTDQATVHLVPLSQILSEDKFQYRHEILSSPLGEKNNTTESTAATTDPDITDGVLQFERQLRKAQHAQKVSQPIDCNDLKVVYVDEHIVVVNKPSGVLAVPGIHSRDSILKLVYDKFGPTRNTSSSSSSNDDDDNQVAMEQMIVHRLDMDTSGLILFGRTLEVTKKLHQQFRDRQVEKEYECLVQGSFPGFSLSIESDNDRSMSTTFHVDLPLQRDHAHPPFMRVSTPDSEAEAAQVLVDLHKRGWTKLTRKRPKPSQTQIRIVERAYRTFESKGDNNDTTITTSLPFTRLRLVPITGRTHQLRVHCAALNFPIVGDPTYSLYGEAAPGGGIAGLSSSYCTTSTVEKSSPTRVVQHACSCPMRVQQAWTKAHPPNERPMCLHAAMLQLKHPVTGETLRWDVPPGF